MDARKLSGRAGNANGDLAQIILMLIVILIIKPSKTG
jgi:hypothetical protein